MANDARGEGEKGRTARLLFATLCLGVPAAGTSACSLGGGGEGAPLDAAAPMDGTLPSADASNEAGVDAGEDGETQPVGNDAMADAPTQNEAGADAGADTGTHTAHDSGGSIDAAVDCGSPSGAPTEIDQSFAIDTTLTCDHVYSFSGTIEVHPPATLTIQPGTSILMQSTAALIVDPGAAIMAVGTASQPIVFTSANTAAPAAGDWGAIALVGRAPGNWGLDLYGDVITQSYPQGNTWTGFPTDAEAGGSEIDDSSGTLAYVRIEYGGCLSAGCSGGNGHEMLGMYGVGAGTLLDHVDIRQGINGCMFAEGGTFAMSRIVCQSPGASGGFDFTRGNQSRAQFLLDQETPSTGGEGLGIKGPPDDNQLEPLTAPTVYNATLCGGGSNGGGTPHGISLVREPAGLIYDVIASQFEDGASMTQGIPTPQGTGLATTQLRSSILFANFGANPGFGVPTNDTDIPTWFSNADWLDTTTDPQVDSCLDAAVLRAYPATTLSANASPPPADGFFDPSAAFIGAFRDSGDTWATGNWIVWSPQ